MNAPAYPFSRTLRKSSITSGNGVTIVWGPSSFKIADVLDVEVWRKDLGDDDFHAVDAVITKTGAGFSTFTVTITPALPSTSQFFYKGRRLHERSIAITQTAQKLDPTALDYELTKLGIIQQEHYRELGEIGTTARDALALAEDLEALVEDIDRVRDEIEASEQAAEAAEDNAAMWAAQALAAAQATGDVLIFDTYAAAASALGSIANLAIVEVLKDETRGGFRTRYRKEAGSLVYKITIGGLRFYDVMSYGAKPDFGAGNTDNTAAFQAAFNDALLHGGTVFVPAGHYYFAQGSAPLDPGLGGFSVVGEYGSSVLHFHEGTGEPTDASAKELIYNADNNSLKAFLYFRGLTIKGTFGDVGRTTRQGGSAVFLDHYKELRFDYCRWENLTCGATDTHFNGSASTDHCVFIDISGDSCRGRENKYTQVTNNYFRRGGDDAVSWHGGKYVEADDYDPDDGTPRREGFVCTGNVFADTSACVTALGARQVLIANNLANRYQTYFCYVTQSSSEGTHPQSNIKITDNIGLNLITGVGAHVIIEADAPRGTAATSGVVPGMPHASGEFEEIWNHQNADTEKAEDAYPPIEGVDVSRNIFGRTLPAVANYSDWGFGLRGSATFGVDGAVTDTNLRPPSGMTIAVSRLATIKDNLISHVQEGIFLAAQANMEPGIVGGIVAGNVLRDVTKRHVAVTGVSGKYVDLDIIHNKFLGDYRRQAAESNADGTYSSAAGPTGLDLGTSYGANIVGNRFSNVALISSAFDRHHWSENTIVADIVGLGDNASNKGVRNLPAVEIGFRYIVAHQDPTDTANYGKIKNVMVDAATAMPTTGFYTKGHVVRNSNISYDGIKVIFGWLRVTTNSSHVLGTDWIDRVDDPRSYLQVFDDWNLGSLAAGDTATTTISVPGAALGDFVDVSFAGNLDGCILTGYVSAADTVKAVIFNPTGSSATISNTVRASVRPRTHS